MELEPTNKYRISFLEKKIRIEFEPPKNTASVFPRKNMQDRIGANKKILYQFFDGKKIQDRNGANEKILYRFSSIKKYKSGFIKINNKRPDLKEKNKMGGSGSKNANSAMVEVCCATN